ncbi:MAG TPA: methyltransferase domain-containing protein [Clostridia bacterium]
MDKEILTLEEAAELFGVSVKTFIKLLKEEKVPARKIGREWRFSRKSLIDWLSAGDSQLYSSSEGDSKEFFNDVAPEWEDIRKNYYDESIKNKLIDLKILKKSMSLADLGSGDGYIARAAAKYVKKITAVDNSNQMLKELLRKASDSGISNIATIEADGRSIPVDSSSFDIVCASMYLHHIDEPKEAIEEMARILKPGGTVFLADFLLHDDTALKEKMHDVWPGFNTGLLTQWFSEKGFTETVIHKVDTGANTKNAGVFILTSRKNSNKNL